MLASHSGKSKLVDSENYNVRNFLLQPNYWHGEKNRKSLLLYRQKWIKTHIKAFIVVNE